MYTLFEIKDKKYLIYFVIIVIKIDKFDVD
jgi:hypothetical protein